MRSSAGEPLTVSLRAKPAAGARDVEGTNGVVAELRPRRRNGERLALAKGQDGVEFVKELLPLRDGSIGRSAPGGHPRRRAAAKRSVAPQSSSRHMLENRPRWLRARRCAGVRRCLLAPLSPPFRFPEGPRFFISLWCFSFRLGRGASLHPARPQANSLAARPFAAHLYHSAARPQPEMANGRGQIAFVQAANRIGRAAKTLEESNAADAAGHHWPGCRAQPVTKSVIRAPI